MKPSQTFFFFLLFAVVDTGVVLHLMRLHAGPSRRLKLTSQQRGSECRRRRRLRSPFGMSAIIAALTGKGKVVGRPGRRWIRASAIPEGSAPSSVCVRGVCVRPSVALPLPLARCLLRMCSRWGPGQGQPPLPSAWGYSSRLCARAAAAKAAAWQRCWPARRSMPGKRQGTELHA